MKIISIIHLLSILLFINHVGGYILPGMTPTDYEKGEEVDLKVNKLTSVHTQLPYDYYSLKFCKPDDGVKPYAENLGELLSGDRIENSPYQLKMLEDINCKVLCQITLQEKDSRLFKTAIRRGYHHNWLIDNLPAASVVDTEVSVVTDMTGFPVGYVSNNVEYLYNHVNIVIDYHEIDKDFDNDDDQLYRIVGFSTEPFSVRHNFVGASSWDGKGIPPPLATCSNTKILSFDDIRNHLDVPKAGPILFTYGVEWKASEVRWASRWDVYLNSSNSTAPDRVHWFSIVNSIMIVMFLATMVGMILYRTLNGEIQRYNAVPTEEERAEEREETGWKLVHADVFRKPDQYPMFFCVCVGSGVQITACAFVSLFFAALGYISPVQRGSIMIGMLLLFVLMGSFSGWTSAWLYKTFKGTEWQRCTTFTALAFPAFCFGIFFVLNFIVYCYGSSEAVPFLTMISILMLWFGISVPMTFLGAFIGYKKDALEFPVVISNTPRKIPNQEWYMGHVVSCMLGGLLPFGACFVELFFVMSSIWMDRYYFLFGFLFVVFLILAVTCAEVSIVMTYFQLCSEDYHWWWRSFCCSACTAVYVFLYSITYFFHLESNMLVTYCLYFGYMTLICGGIFLMTGCIGFLATLYFNLAIYSSIKVD